MIFTFNKPIVALILIPLLLLTFLLTYGVMQELNFLVITMTLVSFLFLLPIIYLSFFRRLRVESDKAEWITPSNKLEMDMEDVKHFGVVKYRSFRFIFFSRLETSPFDDPEAKVVPDEHTFLIQYRSKAWDHIKEVILARHPNLKPLNYTRK